MLLAIVPSNVFHADFNEVLDFKFSPTIALYFVNRPFTDKQKKGGVLSGNLRPQIHARSSESSSVKTGAHNEKRRGRGGA